MAFTRFHDDPARIQKQLQVSTYLGRYQLNRPGPGINLPFFEDPSVRLQGWGANLQTNTVDLESEFRNLNRQLTRDSISENNYKNHLTNSQTPSIGYSSMQPFVEESRASHPAWTYRDVKTSRWDFPILNHQSISHLETPFPSEISTRIVEKDQFIPILPQ